jgi:hypothetical protein
MAAEHEVEIVPGKVAARLRPRISLVSAQPGCTDHAVVEEDQLAKSGAGGPHLLKGLWVGTSGYVGIWQ